MNVIHEWLPQIHFCEYALPTDFCTHWGNIRVTHVLTIQYA